MIKPFLEPPTNRRSKKLSRRKSRAHSGNASVVTVVAQYLWSSGRSIRTEFGVILIRPVRIVWISKYLSLLSSYGSSGSSKLITHVRTPGVAEGRFDAGDRRDRRAFFVAGDSSFGTSPLFSDNCLKILERSNSLPGSNIATSSYVSSSATNINLSRYDRGWTTQAPSTKCTPSNRTSSHPTTPSVRNPLVTGLTLFSRPTVKFRYRTST
mmetsp:Transcript_29436/g.90060  ORF Transcript_29436/g.90060 Transcript_29436/m.90060 type:complete len:210 (+) Transcript_29436:1412-2041(+)